MLNTNYRKYVSFMLYNNDAVVRGKGADLPTYVNNDRDNLFPDACWRASTIPYAQSVNSLSVIVGDGTTPAKDTDMMLENEIKDLTGITATTSAVSTSVVKTVSVTFKNNTADIRTINEVGLIIQRNGYQPKAALLGRVVLDTPVVMSPGDIYTFTYCIE